MILKTVTGLALRPTRREDAPERLLIVEAPCQSDIKRVLRRSGLPPDAAVLRGLLDDLAKSSARMVNAGFRGRPHGFELVDAGTGSARAPSSIENLRDPRSAKIFA